MARFIAFELFNQDRLDLYDSVRYYYDQGLSDNLDSTTTINVGSSDFTYYSRDSFWNQWSVDDITYSTAFISETDISWDGANAHTLTGAVNHIGTVRLLSGGGNYDAMWGITDIGVDIQDLYSVAITVTTDDDTQLIAQILSGADNFYLSDASDLARGYGGNDTMSGNGGNDTLYGGNNNDKLYGGSGNDKSYGEAGNDSLYLDTGNDTLDGGSGTDWLYVTGSTNSVVNLAKTTGQNTGYGTDIIKNIENASGGSGVDKFYGTSGNNTLKGNNGNDLLYGRNGNDTLYGGNNNDKLYGGSGNDTLYGGSGNDILDDGTGTDYVDGGSGIDTFQRNLSDDYSDYAFQTVVDLSAGKFYAVGYENDFDTLISIENVNMTGNFHDRIIGTSGNNTLKGNNGNDLLYGQNGNDKLYGGSGNDKSYGEAGNDSLYLDTGNDTLDGGSGTDWLYVTGSTNSVVNLAKTTGQNTGYGTDIIKNIENASGGSGVDKFYGTSGNNTLKGNNGNDLLYGQNGNDTLYGGNNNDKLYGGSGNDTLRGDAGNDSLQGDAGKDSLTGGSGADTFIFRSVSESATGATTADVITDFVRGSDKINLSAIDAFAGTSANDTFIWKGTAAFNSTSKGEVRYEKFNNDGTANDYTMVYIDNDRDAGVEMAIRLTGLYDLTQSDFIL